MTNFHKCLQCQILTEKPKFCSKSCSAKFNNLHRKRKNICKICGNPRSYKSIFCSDACKELSINSKKLELILVEDSHYNRSHLRNRLIKEGYLENKCSICGLFPIWNNQNLTLQLDHINGKKYDNRIQNLRLLCPNCHSQTSTFSGKNINKNK